MTDLDYKISLIATRCADDAEQHFCDGQSDADYDKLCADIEDAISAYVESVKRGEPA